MTLRYTMRARVRLGQIVGHYLDLDRPAVGLRIAERIRARARELTRHPELGPREPYLRHRRDREYRSLLVDRDYKIVYYVDGDLVTVATVFGVRQDPRKMLG